MAHHPLQVRLLTIDLSFHRAASGVVRSILARHGVEVTETVAPHGLMDRLPAEAAAALRSTYLGNEEVSRLDYLVARDGAEPLDAARTWRPVRANEKESAR
ncbi:hypothetical protein [Acidovorax sacchari]|uniref:hypothetical protein n=1 Tax=Acidovorax sacchari TaxID=3230736 RepID=UPI0039E72555